MASWVQNSCQHVVGNVNLAGRYCLDEVENLTQHAFPHPVTSISFGDPQFVRETESCSFFGKHLVVVKQIIVDIGNPITVLSGSNILCLCFVFERHHLQPRLALNSLIFVISPELGLHLWDHRTYRVGLSTAHVPWGVQLMAVRLFGTFVICIIWYLILGNVSFMHVANQSALGLLVTH